MELQKSQTVLILPVIRLASSPVKPFDGCIPVRPDPLAIVMVRVEAYLQDHVVRFTPSNGPDVDYHSQSPRRKKEEILPHCFHCQHCLDCCILLLHGVVGHPGW